MSIFYFLKDLFPTDDGLTLEQSRNIYYQKQLANELNIQVTEMISLITSSLNIYLNIGQNLTMNTSQTFMSLETISIQSLSNKIVKQIGNAQMHIPSDFLLNTTNNLSISLRVSFYYSDQFSSFDFFLI
jgi:hypothetical protein